MTAADKTLVERLREGYKTAQKTIGHIKLELDHAGPPFRVSNTAFEYNPETQQEIYRVEIDLTKKSAETIEYVAEVFIKNRDGPTNYFSTTFGVKDASRQKIKHRLKQPLILNETTLDIALETGNPDHQNYVARILINEPRRSYDSGNIDITKLYGEPELDIDI